MERRVTGLEIDTEFFVISWMEEPRVSEGGCPVVKAHTLQVYRSDEPVRLLLDEFVESAGVLLDDLLEATSEISTRSLDEVEDEQLENELGIGMGDNLSA